jgi:probable phosphoglycerate mutase
VKRLYYVRHGETVLNVSGHWAGQIETPLTDTGIKQVKTTGKNLRAKSLKIDLIICSPLSRAYDSAKLIAQEIGCPIDKIQKNKLFIERSFGNMEGQSWDKFMETKTLKDMDDTIGAETVADLHARAEEAFSYLKSLKEDNILVVSHGSFGRALMRVINNLPHHLEYDDEHREKLRLANAEVFELI